MESEWGCVSSMQKYWVQTLQPICFFSCLFSFLLYLLFFYLLELNDKEKIKWAKNFNRIIGWD